MSKFILSKLRTVWLLCFVGISPFLSNGVYAAEHAVILTYHHVATDTPASTSINPQTFVEHLAYLDTNGYQVWPVQQIVEHLMAKKPVPEKVVGLTFDDAYASIFTTAAPLLKARNMPFTVFASTALIGDNAGTYMSWSQLRALYKDGVDIANHSHNHLHYPTLNLFEVKNQLDLAENTLREKVSSNSKLFAYPYGEFTQEVAKLISSNGWIGFGQHSGPIGFHSNFAALPRFPLGGNYSSIKQLKQRLNIFKKSHNK